MRNSQGFRLFYILTFPLLAPIMLVTYLIAWLKHGGDLKKPGAHWYVQNDEEDK